MSDRLKYLIVSVLLVSCVDYLLDRVTTGDPFYGWLASLSLLGAWVWFCEVKGWKVWWG